MILAVLVSILRLGGISVPRFGLMRCLMCGHEMVLIAALPAEDGFVHGFEQQTLQCRACGETWHRFVFTPAISAAAVEMGKLASPPACIGIDVCPSNNEKDKSVPSADEIKTVPGTNENGRPALVTDSIDNAVRALNGIDQPAFIANEMRKPLVKDWRIKAVASAKEKPSARDQALTKLERSGIQGNGVAFDARESTSVSGNNTPPERWSQAVEKFRRYEAGLNRHTDSRTRCNANGTHPFTTSRIQRPKSPQRSIPNDFDAVWNGHMPVPDQQKGMEHSVASASLVPLPRALSLVVIEPQEASPHTRGDKHGSKKMLEKLYNWLTRASAMPERADLV